MRIASVVRLVSFLILAVGLSSCSSVGEDPAPSGLDPNIPPVTEGNWYRPPIDVTWQWQLSGAINTGYVVEIYDVDIWETPDALIQSLHASGRKVICYFSAGTGDINRDDYGEFLASDLGRQLGGFPDEHWLDVRSSNVLRIMLARLDLAVSRSCDGVEPDNVDGYTNNSGFDFTATDQLAFNRRLANEAHTRGLSIALKNSGDQASNLVEYFDFDLNEECLEFNECDQWQPFLAAEKPVLNVEYAGSKAEASAMAQTVCPLANAEGLRTLIMPFDLDDEFRVSCF